MWSDNETANDLIGFQVHADLIRACVTNPKMLPLTIGVFGDWGGGKTSIMKMLERDLDPRRWPEASDEQKACDGLAVVYVNTWLFEGYDDAKAALLSSVLLALAENKHFGAKLRDGAISLLKSVNWMRFARLAFKHIAIPAAGAFATGGVAAIPAAVALSSGLSTLLSKKEGTEKDAAASTNDGPQWGEAVKDADESRQIDVRTFRERFTKMLADGGVRTLVVLVDDLDRCTPDRIVENLEAIKLFLSVDQSAFVIGADRRIVEHAIRCRYAVRATDSPDDDESKRLVKDYLEKLVQVPYSLPRLSASEIQTYMVLLFCQHLLSEDDFKLCLAACGTSRDRNRYGSFGYGDVMATLKGKDMRPGLGEALAFSAAAAPLVADGLKGNPRQVKRFLNALLLRKELARVAGLKNIRDDVLVKLMILEYAHLERFTELFGLQAAENGQPAKLEKLEALLAGPKGDLADEEAAAKIDSKWSTTAVRRWIAMEPSLKDIDLRDYFWVARDRLESTFTGITMVSPVVRATLAELFSEHAPKRHSGLETAKSLREDERATLLDLIDQRITRQPGEKSGYDALRLLAEGGVIGGAELLARILLGRPLEMMPTTVGMDVMNLINGKPALRTILDPVKKRLCESQSKIGKAAQAAQSRR